ncbi:MAG: sulfurtransferase [Deltaproteobacteria bacterium HGW-Deltaproteobacteria-15]|nr:MAG: sulfurtransferase [Deltaproteobacteria bacterium HGW-Deltaproteobacteria-15]
MLVAFAIGMAFGLSLEQAGFGSSRRLASIFYFRDMTVLKVMFTALLVAMLGLQYAQGLGLIDQGQLFFMPSIYGAQIVGGLLFGVGFVMGGWCPGTAAVGLASGRLDALVFLAGAGIGSVLFNEMFGIVKGFYTWGDRGVQFAWQALDLSAALFGLLLVLVAVACFWGAEYMEKRVQGTGRYWRSPFLRSFSTAMVLLALGSMALQSITPGEKVSDTPARSATFLEQIESAEDHMEPEEVADRLMQGDKGLMLVDIRPAEEYALSHIAGAVNIPLSDLPAALSGNKGQGTIVLYSNGMTHPAQARDALARMGHTNIYILTDGLVGFVDRILKPASLRAEPLSAARTEKINAWRKHFAAPASPAEAAAEGSLPISQPTPPVWPGLVEPAWLSQNLGSPEVRVIEIRPQPQYNSGHIPGAVCVSPENLRGVVGGVSSMLKPAHLLAEMVSLMGIRPTDTVVLVPDDKLQDGTLVAMAFARIGHERFGILNGGFQRWILEKRPVTTELPQVQEFRYPVAPPDGFTVTYRQVLESLKAPDTVIIDVRPTEFYTGQKVEEARGGHIPGAKNRPYTEDVSRIGNVTMIKPLEELAKAYALIVPTRQTKTIVHCRTGHQASQTYFVMRYLLGYQNLFWYDAGWSEWASRSELPVEN